MTPEVAVEVRQPFQERGVVFYAPAEPSPSASVIPESPRALGLGTSSPHHTEQSYLSLPRFNLHPQLKVKRV